MLEQGHDAGDLLIIEIGSVTAPPGLPRNTVQVDFDDDSDATRRLRVLLKIDPPPSGGIRGVVTCRHCGSHGLLWFGSHDAVRERQFLELGDLTPDEFLDVQLLLKALGGARAEPAP